MATTSYGTNNPLAVKLWSKKLNVEVLKTTWATKFMGTGSASVIQIKDETQKSAGDKITYGLRLQLTGAGVVGDGTLEGMEEQLTTYSDALIIDQLRHAVVSGGRASQQRVPFSVRDEALSGLRDWWAGRIDNSFFAQIGGDTVQTNTAFTGLQATIAPDSAHLKVEGQTGEGSLAAANTFVLGLIDSAIEVARTATPAIRPTQVGGKGVYVAFMHPYQVTDMRESTTTGQWLDIQKAAMTGGEIEDNPIFDGSLGMYNGCLLHSDTRVPQAISSSAYVTSTRRAVFAGAQAAVMGYGREDGPYRFTWVEELFDFQNRLGVAAGMIWGLKKSVFNGADYATVVLATYAAAH